jgi:predicted GH43/DUF377 family glycosyl hydrolase
MRKPTNRIFLRIANFSPVIAYILMSAMIGLAVPGAQAQGQAQGYPDGRPTATLRMNAVDAGPVLRYGACPGDCDLYGARDAWVFHSGKTFYMHYDAAGPKGWLVALATSKDLVHWKKHGTVLDLGPKGSDDSASASYGTTYFDGHTWHMFYLGTPNVTSPPDRTPMFPYLTLKARALAPTGPWIKQPDVVPFRPVANTYYSATASPGQIIHSNGEYLQFFSASTDTPIKRTISIARTKNLNGKWVIDPAPIVPADEQIENTSLYFDRTIHTWFLFTDHIGLDQDGEYTDAIWVYWTKNLNRWNAKDKAIILDKRNSVWSKRCIGLPSVIRFHNKLAIFYDSPGEDSVSHMRRSIGLAWLNLPLHIPAQDAK